MALTMLVGGTTALVAETHEGPNGDEQLSKGAGLVVIAMVVGYMFSFGMSWGFGAWLYISEIMPLRVRGKAVGLCTGVNWGPANVISAFATPAMIAGPMGPGGTLLFFGLISAVVVPMAVLCLPETRGRSLEDITPMFRFSTYKEFRAFVQGNIRSGDGMGADRAVQKQAQQELKSVSESALQSEC